MNLTLRLTRALVLTLLTLIGFAVVAWNISGDVFLAFDTSIITYVRSFETPWLTTTAEFFSWIGSVTGVGLLLVLAVGILYFGLKHRAETTLLIGVMMGSSIVGQVLKRVYERPRPSDNPLAIETSWSFPSGHSVAAMAFYGIITYLFWRHIKSPLGRGVLLIVSALMIAAITWSRVYLGVHYPSDIMGGLLFGGCWLFASIWVYQSYRERRATALHSIVQK